MLDASALIALYSEADRHHQWALQMFNQTANSRYSMPALTLAEVLVSPVRMGKQHHLLTSIAGLAIDIAPIASGDALTLAELRVQTGLKMPDVVVLHHAHSTGAELATTDERLSKVAKRLGVSTHSPYR